jgi:DNA-binding transcriptional MerR regulator/effector-binding domain-containing protein
MSELIPIGRFAQITHLSVKALRIYAHEGLLQPMYVDPESGYRYYTLAQAALAARIRLLRLVDMPLEEIRAVLQAPDPETMRMYLTHHHRRITDRMARDQQSLLLLQRVHDRPDAFLSFEVQVKEVPDQPLLSLCTHAAPGTFGQAVRSAFGTLMTSAIEIGVYLPDQPPLVIIHQYTPQEYQEGGTDFEVGLPVLQVVESGQGIVSTLLPGGTVASVVHIGPYHELELIYPVLGAWIEAQGYVITGPPRNLILTNHALVTDPTGYQTDVQWPIAKGAEQCSAP